jgi:Leucine-rich repeat (LRR) protein
MSSATSADGQAPPAASVRRRSWRFRIPLRVSVRGLLVAILVIAASFGWVVRRAHVERDAAAAITEAGGTFAFDWQKPRPQSGGKKSQMRDGPWAPKWLVEFMGPHYFAYITDVQIARRNREAVLEHVGRLTHLERLQFSNGVSFATVIHALLNTLPSTGLARIQGLNEIADPPVDGACLRYLKDLTRLKTLRLPENIALTDADLFHLRRLTELDRLELHDPRITDSGVRWLKDMKSLTWLDLAGTQVSSAGLKSLAALNRLYSLHLGETRVDELGPIAHLTALTQLDLAGTPIDDTGLAPIVAMTGMTSLNLTNTKITNAGLAHLKNHTKLFRLKLSRTRIDDDASRQISALTALDTLQLDETQITDAALVRFRDLPKLKLLDVRGTRVSNAGLASLTDSSSLTAVWAQQTKITRAGVSAFGESRPDVTVSR